MSCHDAQFVSFTTLSHPLILIIEFDDQGLDFIKAFRNNQLKEAVVVATQRQESPVTPEAVHASEIDDILLLPLDDQRLESHLRFIIRRAGLRAERQQIEMALRSSEARARAVMDTTVEGIITIDAQGSIHSFNRAAEQIFGYDAKELLGQDVSVLMPAPYRDEHDGYVKSYHETGHKKIIGIGREVKGLRKSGEIFPLELAVSEMEIDGERAYTGIVRDISERRKLEKEILVTSEAERRRIGQDLHDGLGQMLTGIGLITKNLALKLEPTHEELSREALELVDLIKEADQQARSIARTLIPIELENGGLKASVTRLAANIQRLYNLQCTVQETGEILMQEASAITHFYRIIQEAMGNAARHSQATHISVAIAGSDRQIRARIKDNGIGIDLDRANGHGMGLRIMQHRAHVIGATLDVRPGSENGTVVTCTLPILPPQRSDGEAL